MHIGNKQLAFLDTETTGLIPGKHEVIEVAIIVENRLHHWYIRPERLADADEKALQINGYATHPERWHSAVSMNLAGPEILDVLRDKVVVGHNVNFDLEMLSGHFRVAGVKHRLPYHKVDTVTLAYTRLVPLGLSSLSLDKIREFLCWSKENAHSAIKDVRDTERLYRLLVRNRASLRARVFLQQWLPSRLA
jgi:DNA polymerase III epsilon subunit-like protein